MTSKRTDPSYGLPPPITKLTMEQDLKMRVIRDKITEGYHENKEEIIEILNNGKVIFNKSEPNKEPCGMYYIKSGDFNIDVINCENEATIMIN